MGWLPILFISGLVASATLWYLYFARYGANRNGAIYHIFERLGRLRYEGLNNELFDIMKEKGLREEDQFEDVIARSQVIDLEEETRFDRLVHLAAERLSPRLNMQIDQAVAEVMKSSRTGATPVAEGVALLQFCIPDLPDPELVLVRGMQGLHATYHDPVLDTREEIVVHAVFFLVSPADTPALHLRTLARIAERTDDDHFGLIWDAAVDEHALRDISLRNDRYVNLQVLRDSPTGVMIGKPCLNSICPADAGSCGFDSSTRSSYPRAIP